MDLLATIRKEGSRGGQGDFKWSDVQNSTRREHYLGHSLMAPVGRWQKGRDLNWYTKTDEGQDEQEDPATKAERERKEEIRRVKEAEEDALARALGLPVTERRNANTEPLGEMNSIKRSDPSDGRDDVRSEKRERQEVRSDRSITDMKEGDSRPQDRELQYALKEYRRRHGDHKSERTRDRRERSHRPDREDSHRSRRDKPREQSPRSRNRDRTHNYKAHSRSRSPRIRHSTRDRSRSRSPRRSRKREER